MKPGILSSELWALVAAVALAESQALTSNPQLNYAGMAVAAVYAVCRTILKHGGGGAA